MSSNNLSRESGSLDVSSEALSNKETQTSSAFITDSFDLVKGPSRPLPKGIHKSDAEPPVNIVDYRVIKVPSDSKSLEIVNESFVKGIVNTNSSNSDDIVSANSQKHCDEVGKPHLNPQLNEHEDDIKVLEKINHDSLVIPDLPLDIPDQPCNDNQTTKNIEDKLENSSTNNMDFISKIKNRKSSDDKKSSSETKSENSDNQPNLKKLSTSNKDNCSDQIEVPENETNGNNENIELNKSISKESIAKCVENSLTAIKKTASSCFEKIEIIIGIKKPENPNEKPTFYAVEKPTCNVSHNVETETGRSLYSIKNMISNPNETMCSVKETCKDLACKLYKTSNDAVTFLTSESAKLLNKAVKENNSDGISNEQNDSDSFVEEADNDIPSNESIKMKIMGCANITDAVPPAVKLSFCKLRDNMVSSKFDKSSPYDKPVAKEISNEVSQISETKMPSVSAIDHPDSAETSNMFSILKSKILSMFHDEGETEPVIQENAQDDEEEDPFEKFMEQ